MQGLCSPELLAKQLRRVLSPELGGKERWLPRFPIFANTPMGIELSVVSLSEQCYFWWESKGDSFFDRFHDQSWGVNRGLNPTNGIPPSFRVNHDWMSVADVTQYGGLVTG